MTTLADFLLARIAEDEAGAPESGWTDAEGRCGYCGGVLSARVLAECEAKRRIVELHQITYRDLVAGQEVTCAVCKEILCTDALWSGCSTLRLLSQPYADHPDYSNEWRDWRTAIY